MLFENFVSTFKSNYKFLFVIKTIEDYWGCLRHEQEKLYNYIESSNNIKVISDISELKLKNVIFNPKIHIRNYYNFSYAFPCDLFLYGYDVFNIINKEKRIGVHFNKVVDVIRRGLVEKLYDIKNDNLFFTVNKDAFDNEKLFTSLILSFSTFK